MARKLNKFQKITNLIKILECHRNKYCIRYSMFWSTKNKIRFSTSHYHNSLKIYEYSMEYTDILKKLENF